MVARTCVEGGAVPPPALGAEVTEGIFVGAGVTVGAIVEVGEREGGGESVGTGDSVGSSVIVFVGLDVGANVGTGLAVGRRSLPARAKGRNSKSTRRIMEQKWGNDDVFK
jgi:hypothetical protein